MEACCGAHRLGARLAAQGHQPRLIPAQFVKPFVKSNKNDSLDAEAIAEAVQRPRMRFVPIKTDDQLDLQALHRVRDQRPSLLTLRKQLSVFVRMIHRYYAAVRLLDGASAGLAAIAFSRPPAAGFRQQVSSRPPGSRVRSFQACLGSTTSQDRAGTRDSVPTRIAFRWNESVGILIAVFRSSIPSPPVPLSFASLGSSRITAPDSGPSGSLLLSRKALASSASYPFIPAHRSHFSIVRLLMTPGSHPGLLGAYGWTTVESAPLKPDSKKWLANSRTTD
jgi:hypothetical protein